MGSLFTSNITPKFQLIKKLQHFELRKYCSYVVAETSVKAEFQNAGSIAFRPLAGYIFGNNQQNAKIPMTAPVTQQSDDNSEKIQFMMPEEWNLQTLPKPKDSRVNLKKIPQKYLAVIGYTGGWSKQTYDQHLKLLESKMRQQKLTAIGTPIWARYNSPWTPSFLRKNQICLEYKNAE